MVVLEWVDERGGLAVMACESDDVVERGDTDGVMGFVCVWVGVGNVVAVSTPVLVEVGAMEVVGVD